MTSLHAVAGIGGLNVQSNLGEQFSGSIVVTGSEAVALIKSGTVSVSGGGISGTVVPQGQDRAVIRLRSAAVIQDPVLNFVVRAGNQTRQYTAMINPVNYKVQTPNVRPSQVEHQLSKTGVSPSKRRARVQESATQEYDFIKHDDVQTATSTFDEQVEKQATRQAIQRATRYHRVQAGESLASIAARYRPHNMSVQRAMRALMAANPRAFRKGTGLMYRNVTLYIPTASQFHAYANKAQRRVAQAHLHRHGASITGVAENLAKDELLDNDVSKNAVKSETASVKEPTTATVSEEKVTAPAEKVNEAVNKTVPAEDNNNGVAKKDVQPEPKPAASEPKETKPAVEPKVTEPSTPTVEENTASVSSAPTAEKMASEVIASESASAVVEPAPVASASEKPKPTKPVVNEPVEEESSDTDWMALGLGVLVGLGVVGAGAYVLQRRRNEESSDDSDDDVYEEEHIPTASEAAQRLNLGTHEAAQKPVSIPEEVYTEEVYTEPEPVQVSKNNSFDLNNFEPEIATVKTQNTEEKWDWAGDDVIASEPEPAVNVTDDSEWTNEVFEVHHEETSAPVATETEWSAETFEIHEPASTTVSEPNDDWLSDSFEINETLAEPVAPAVETTVSDDFFNMHDVEEVATPAAEAETSVSNELDSLDFNISNEPAVTPEKAPEIDTPSMDFNIADIPAVEEPKLEDNSMSFELPETIAETPAVDTPSLDLPSIEDTATSFDLPDSTAADLTFDIPAVETEQPIVDPVEMASLDSLDMLATEDYVANEPTQSEPISVAAPDELLDWHDLSNTPNDVDIVSESVGMTAPLEAKLELAKMYLEIDDAVAARETLRELISESTGSVQAQAKELLEELGG